MSNFNKNIIQKFTDSDNQKWFLAAMILVLLAPVPITFFPQHVRLIFTLSYSFLIIGGIVSLVHNKSHLTILLIIGIISFVFLWKAYFGEQNTFNIHAKTISLFIFFSYLAFHLYQKIAKSKAIQINIIYASISGYLLIGLIGGLAFQGLELAIPDSFNSAAPSYTLYDLQYFSFVSITSLGFGDITPKTEAAKSLTLIFTLAGQLYLTILVAILVGKMLR